MQVHSLRHSEIDLGRDVVAWQCSVHLESTEPSTAPSIPCKLLKPTAKHDYSNNVPIRNTHSHLTTIFIKEKMMLVPLSRRPCDLTGGNEMLRFPVSAAWTAFCLERRSSRHPVRVRSGSSGTAECSPLTLNAFRVLGCVRPTAPRLDGRFLGGDNVVSVRTCVLPGTCVALASEETHCAFAATMVRLRDPSHFAR
jgi:hypothetical protein